ncbi:MAG: 6-pyruvoyl-tetrahydropterin synthase-related protein [Anaerolineales bacterium]
MALALAVLGAGLWSGGPAPAGHDSWGHLYRSEYLAQAIRDHGWSAYFRTAWLPDWYMGDPFRTYYPPLAVDLLGPLVVGVGDPFLAVRLFNSILLLAVAGVTYLCLLSFLPAWQAGLGTTLSLIAPFQVRTIFQEGNFNRSLSLLALPLIAALTEKLLSAKGRRGPAAAALAVCWCFAILSHPQQALIYGIGFGVYILGRLFFDPDLPLKRAGGWVLAITAGALLSAAWTLPAYSQGEIPNIPYQPAEMSEIYSLRLSAVLPALDMTQGQVLLGTGTLILGLLAAAARPEPRRSAYIVAGLLALWLSFGSKGVLYTLLPLNQQLLPERFINFAAFAFAVAACGLLPLGRSARWVRAFVVGGLVLVDFLPSVGATRGKDIPTSMVAMRDSLAPYSNQVGRTALFTYPEPGSANVYYAGKATDQIFGWALQNTPHHLAIRRVLGAPKWGPDYIQHLLSLWNVRWAVVGGPSVDADPVRSVLREAGFQEVAAGEFQTWVRGSDPGPVQALPENRMLVLGDRLPPFLAVYPFAEESPSLTLGDVPELDLTPYPALALYRFESTQAGIDGQTERLTRYLNQGGRVILDLSGMEDLVGRTLEFVGVDVLRISFAEPIPVRWASGLEGLPQALHIADISPEGWSGAAYDGLDEVLAEVQYQGTWWPILGYKRVGAGQVWFVGANLLYYAQLSGNTELGERIRDLTLEGVDVYRQLDFPALPIVDWQASGTGLSFTVEGGAEPHHAVVSYTYSPRWRATLDGEPWLIGEYEHLMTLEIPPGPHEVVISYSAYGTIWPNLGLALTLLAIAGVLGGVWLEARRYIPMSARPPSSTTAAAPEYAPCANCGFRLAEVGPPSPITYPFQVVHCPICGMRMDDEGFQAGESLDEDGRQRALAAWLRRNDYDPEIVHTKWGFAAKEFFTPVPLPPPPEPRRGELSSGGE